MKMNIKSLTIYLGVFCMFSLFLSSCSKDKSDDPEGSDQVIRISIESTGDIQYYDGLLTVSGTIDSKQKGVAVSGISWDDETTSGEVTVYSKDFAPVINTVNFKTDRKASGIQFGYSAWLNDSNAENIVPMKAVIKYYVNDELVKTETYQAGVNTNVEPYLGRLDSKDY